MHTYIQTNKKEISQATAIHLSDAADYDSGVQAVFDKLFALF